MEADLGLMKVKTLSSSSDSDFSTQSLARFVDTPSFNKLIVKTWQEKACKFHNISFASLCGVTKILFYAADRRSTLGFCVNRQHVQNLARVFREANIETHWVDSGTPAKERLNIVTSFMAGAFPVLLNCGKASSSSNGKP